MNARYASIAIFGLALPLMYACTSSSSGGGVAGRSILEGGTGGQGNVDGGGAGNGGAAGQRTDGGGQAGTTTDSGYYDAYPDHHFDGGHSCNHCIAQNCTTELADCLGDGGDATVTTCGAIYMCIRQCEAGSYSACKAICYAYNPDGGPDSATDPDADGGQADSGQDAGGGPDSGDDPSFDALDACATANCSTYCQ